MTLTIMTLYTIEVTNSESTDAENVVVTDVLPAGVIYVSSTPAGTYDANTGEVTWNLGTIPQGTVTLTLTVSTDENTPVFA